jgi:hypothetical protein
MWDRPIAHNTKPPVPLLYVFTHLLYKIDEAEMSEKNQMRAPSTTHHARPRTKARHQPKTGRASIAERQSQEEIKSAS